MLNSISIIILSIAVVLLSISHVKLCKEVRHLRRTIKFRNSTNIILE